MTSTKIPNGIYKFVFVVSVPAGEPNVLTFWIDMEIYDAENEEKW